MDLACKQACYALGNTGTNPAVGCVVVKDGCVISAARTSHAGRPHAEFNAINNVKLKFKGTDLYATLEPCSHHGKTPPSVDKIIKSKINRVVIGLSLIHI